MKRISLLLVFSFAGVLLVSAQDTTRVRFRVSVSDPSGRSVTGLKPENFRVRENGVERKVVSATLSDEPASVVIMIDVSASLAEFQRQNALDLIGSLVDKLNPRNEYMVLTFAEQTHSSEDWISSKSKLKTSLEDTTGSSRLGERTLLYDALADGLSKAESGSLSRKALIIFTDGRDTGSKTGLKEITKRIKHLDLPIYALSMVDFRESGKFPALYGRARLDEITAGSGGYLFEIRSNYRSFEFPEKLADYLKSQYAIEWETIVTKTDKSWRDVDIACEVPDSKKLRIISREGYFLDALPVGK